MAQSAFKKPSPSECLFQGFIGGHKVTDTQQINEILFSIGAGSPEEVDLDGHSWNVLYMDMSKMPKA